MTSFCFDGVTECSMYCSLLDLSNVSKVAVQENPHGLLIEKTKELLNLAIRQRE
jgi:hypothetical protein